ncbi:hypothetical protein [Pedobacter sp. Leaf194]|uniref:hypothetical protein n=1 Tax=Pedobacter sp. Leaf194 TaxID=1736297 RepID=UPI00070272F3|nr:hypothetical protein [Pedobacter sp. Leaf194]KQS32278.1 hypothetical protein ASG14_17190 [Pedobacter sp. Leaf194]
MNSSYQILYLFENPDILITEIKRLDLPADAKADELYHWLFLEKSSLSFIKLWFRSMDSSSEIEERYFEQGYLKFNETEATYIEKYNSSQHKLINRIKEASNHEVRTYIDAYLKQV